MNLFFRWMQQPGLVKKLEGALCISVILNAGLAIELIKHNQKNNLKHYQSMTRVKENNSRSIEKIHPQQDPKVFAKKYLDNFFRIDDTAFDYIAKHSEATLFHNTLEAELNNRKSQNLASEFLISDIFMENFNDKEFKALVIGQEKFKDSSLLAREISLELVIDNENSIVKEIPRFEVK